MWNVLSNERAVRATENRFQVSRPKAAAAREDAAVVREQVAGTMHATPATNVTSQGGKETIHTATIAEGDNIRTAAELRTPTEDAAAGQGRATTAVEDTLTEKTSEDAKSVSRQEALTAASVASMPPPSVDEVFSCRKSERHSLSPVSVFFHIPGGR